MSAPADTDGSSRPPVGDEPVDVVERDEPLDTDVPWQRLSGRMIVVDVVRTLLSVAPSVVAFVLLDVPLTWGTGGPLLGLALFGGLGAASDAVRWATTRYRLTEHHLERRTGLFVRRYRSVRRERVRSVDTDARLRHRLAGLRVVLVGAGQQSAAMESALALDAVVRRDAEQLQRALLSGPAGPTADAEQVDDEVVGRPGEPFATLEPWWVVYNVLGVWVYLSAAGLVWGGTWFLGSFGIDVLDLGADAVAWDDLGHVARILVVVAALTFVGVLMLSVTFFTTNWGFRLERVPSSEGTQLRTRHGLLRTRDVSRDDRRLRGVMLSEPLLWRWMRMADTEVITTGLSIWSTSQPATILPRGPRSVARRVASLVLDHDPDPVREELTRPPARALRRRLVWATTSTIVVVALAAYATWWTPLPSWTVAAAVALWPLALAAAWAAYRALGHGLAGDYAIVRSGFVSRRSAILRRDAVSTIVLRESLFQRRLGLRSVTLATAAGWGGYAALDLTREESVRFALEAAPGLLDPYVTDGAAAPGHDLVDPTTPRP